MTAEFAELQPLIDLLKIFDAAMATEGVDSGTRRRIVNGLLYGNPDGDPTAVFPIDLEPPYRGPLDPVYPCRHAPTRHCPVVLNAQCSDVCARFNDLPDEEARRLWLPEIPRIAKRRNAYHGGA